MKKYFLFVAVAVIGLVACNKSKVADDLTSFNKEERVFTDEQIEQIGQIHNATVIEMITNFNYNSEDIQGALTEQKLQYNIYPMELVAPPLGISSEKYCSGILQANLSEQAHKFIYEIADVCVKLDNVNAVERYIEQQKMFAKENFKCIELDVVLTAITVFKYSSQLWFEETKGGMGLGSIFVNNYMSKETELKQACSPMKSSEKETKLKRCLIADGVYAAEAAVIAGAIACVAPNHITIAGALIGIGVSAAYGSIKEIVKILLDVAALPINIIDELDLVIRCPNAIIIRNEIIAVPLVNTFSSGQIIMRLQ